MTSPAGIQGPGFLLLHVANSWQRSARVALQPFGLTHVQYALLSGVATLSKDRQAVTQRKLALFTKSDAMMTSQVVRSLVSRGLLARTDHPSDSRAFSLTLTSKGQKLLKEAGPALEQVDKKFFDPLDMESIVDALGALAPREA